MGEHLTRRAFITESATTTAVVAGTSATAVTALVALVVPQVATSAPQASASPIMARYLEWKAQLDYATSRRFTDDDMNDLMDRMSGMADELLAMESTCPLDVVAKFIVETFDGSDMPGMWADFICDEARWFLAGGEAEGSDNG